MFDLLIRNARLVDGTGAPARSADLGVVDGHIAEIGNLKAQARRTIDAQSQVLAPGFIDVHTHYDAQVFWDPTISPSCLHGVTTVLSGNCGFSIAPLSKEAAPYLLRMLARVEGMPVKSLETGVPWDWESFGEFLGRLDSKIGVNMGFMCGHSALRRVVMGERALHAHATPEELERMKALLGASLREGAMGFSSTISTTHNDAEGHPVPSRHASREEIIALARICRDHPGTMLELLPGVENFGAFELELMTEMSLVADRILNWNALVVTPGNETGIAHQMTASDHARRAGAEVVALAMAAKPSVRLNFHSGFLLDSVNGWAELFKLPVKQRIAALNDPEMRRVLAERAAADTSDVGKQMTVWSNYVVANSGDKTLENQKVGELALRLGKTPLDVMFDIAVADELRTVFLGPTFADDETIWARRSALWRDDRTILGASDAGAHLDMLDAFAFSTSVLAAVRDQHVFSLEEGVHHLTQAPAELMGLKDRGVIREGWRADLVLFDPDTVGPGATYMRTDLPGDEMRLFSDAAGISQVIVDGRSIVEEGSHTGALPGHVIRSGRDTETRRPADAARALRS